MVPQLPPMTAEEQRRLATVEQRLMSHEERCTERWEACRRALERVEQNQQDFRDFAASFRGGTRVAMWFSGGVGGVLGAALMRYLPGLWK